MRTVRWTMLGAALTLTLLIASAWTFSQFRMTSYYSLGTMSKYVPSFMAYRNGLDFNNGGLYRRPGWEVSHQLGGGPWWPFTKDGPPGFWAFGLPFWIPLAIAALPTALLWFFRPAKRFRTGCPKCSYNLTGNVSGTCPECGSALAANSAFSPTANPNFTRS